LGSLYSLTKSQAAIIAIVRAMRDKTGNGNRLVTEKAPLSELRKLGLKREPGPLWAIGDVCPPKPLGGKLTLLL